jgi:hypothetical protein
MNKKLIAIAVLAGLAKVACAASVDYSVTGLSGTWAYGNTEWNGYGSLGNLDNTTQVGTVDALLHSAYTYSAPNSAATNGIYNFPSSAAIVFSTAGMTTFDSLTVLSSRSYSPTTTIRVDYSNDGGLTWLQALNTSTGALGWVDVGTGGSATETITMALGGVQGDELRFSANGSQISLHTVSIDGVSVVPEPSATAMLVASLGLIGFAAKRRRKQ